MVLGSRGVVLGSRGVVLDSRGVVLGSRGVVLHELILKIINAVLQTYFVYSTESILRGRTGKPNHAQI